MALNKAKGNMYPWITHTWNPLGGDCFHNCSYCSTKHLKRYPVIKKKYSGDPKIDEKMMQDNLGKDKFIFVVAQNDLFAEAVPNHIIRRILTYCARFDNKYLFQTKNPHRLLIFQNELKVLNFTLCTTIETNRFYSHIMRDCPVTQHRSDMMNEISNQFTGVKNYVTIEPIMDFDLEEMIQLIQNCHPEQVNIGADSKRSNLPEPSKEKIDELIIRLQEFTKVKIKSNLKRITGEVII